jgi:hypothetical protein
MKIKIRPVLISVGIIIFFSSTFWSQQRPEWKGKRESVNGAVVVKNPAESLYGEIKIELREELSIGRKDDPNYKFNRLRGMAVDNKGRIYVSDMSNARVQQYSPAGQYLGSLGKNLGPGKLLQPTKILIDETSGNIYVQDNDKINIYARDGGFLAQIMPQKYPRDFAIGQNGDIFIKASPLTIENYGNQTVDFCKIDTAGKVVRELASFPHYLIIQAKQTGGVISGYSGLEHDLVISNFDSQSFIYGFSKEYDLKIINEEGEVLLNIQKDEAYRKFPPNEIKRLIKSPAFYKLPPHMPFFYSFLTDNHQRIYVQRNMNQGKLNLDQDVDIFNKDGYYLYTSTLPQHTFVIKDGLLYALKIDVDGGMDSVKRYRILNWEKIKE